jgi:hypothetical protein
MPNKIYDHLKKILHDYQDYHSYEVKLNIGKLDDNIKKFIKFKTQEEFDMSYEIEIL